MMRKVVAVGFSSLFIAAGVAGSLVLTSSGTNHSSATDDVVTLIKATEKLEIIGVAPETTIATVSPSTTQAPTSSTRKPTTTTALPRPARTMEYRQAALANGQAEIEYYRSIGLENQGGWGNQVFVTRIEDVTKHKQVFVITQNGKTFDVLAIPGAAKDDFIIGEELLHNGSIYPTLIRSSSNERWLIDEQAKSFTSVARSDISED